MLTTIHHRQLADIIPDPDTIRQRIERLETEARLLRRLLTVSLRREREAQRLHCLEQEDVHAQA